MLKNLSQLEIKIGDRTYQFLCAIDAPISEAKEALFQFQKYIGQIEDNVKAQQEAQKAEEAQKEAENKPAPDIAPVQEDLPKEV